MKQGGRGSRLRLGPFGVLRGRCRTACGRKWMQRWGQTGAAEGKPKGVRLCSPPGKPAGSGDASSYIVCGLGSNERK